MEKAILAGLELPQQKWNTEETMRELEQLAETAGAVAVGRFVQKRDARHPAYYMGRGKAAEIADEVTEKEAEIVIIDDELSPTQTRNLEEITGVRVVDRSALILDIFAQRAQTREGKLQVELAQLNYLMPRLTGRGKDLSKLAGGIGTRGPGETKLETDRRRLRRRINDLRKEIEQIKKHRALHREARKSVPFPVISLVGYTNAGKSTLLNALTDAKVLAEDKLFATLDPVTRQVQLPGGMIILLTDTVGFIKKLPHHLVAAFRATLEEIVEADILLHVVDTSHPNAEGQITAVNSILSELEVTNKKTLMVFNKMDMPESSTALAGFTRNKQEWVAVSAQKGHGIEKLLLSVEEMLLQDFIAFDALVPYGSENVLELIRKHGMITTEEFTAKGVEVKAFLPDVWISKVKQMILERGLEV